MNERPQSRLRWKVPFSLCMWNPRRWMWWHFLQNKKRPLITRYFYEWSKTQVDDNLFSSLLYSFLFHVSVKYARGYVAREHWKKDILCIFVFLLLPILSYPPTPTFSKQFGPATLSSFGIETRQLHVLSAHIFRSQTRTVGRSGHAERAIARNW